ncbi:MAG: tol-pal system protein YbgF [Candidatus Cloacimonetes bacterium]|nr:tol-pal system protein YbgF [Candidatus Cloacimonadota bacterium]
MKSIILVSLLFLLGGCALNKINSSAEMESRIETLESNLGRLSQLVDSLSTTDYSGNEKELLRRIVQLEKQIGELQNNNEELIVNEQIPAPSQDVVIEHNTPENNVFEEYKNIKVHYDQNKYNLAISKFTDFMKKYPNEALTSNAQYWIAESFYALKDLNTALSEFQKVIDFFPDSNKAPDSMYKLGKCYYELDMPDQAKIELNRISTMYPDYERQNLVDELLRKME